MIYQTVGRKRDIGYLSIGAPKQLNNTVYFCENFKGYW